MSFTIPDDLDLLTNIKSGVDSRIQSLTEQKKSLIMKNQKGTDQEKQFFRYLIRETSEEIDKLKDFNQDLLKYVQKTFDLTPEYDLEDDT